MKKILIYSHDTFGLGNIRRMLAIAKYLSSGGYSILIVTGSPMLHAFRIESGIDYVKLPCLGRDSEGDNQVRALDMDYDAIIRLRANLILSTVADFQPHLILVDKKPLGLSNELAPALEAAYQSGRRPKLVLLLRDILDSAEATIKIWQEQGYHEVIHRFYDLMLVVGEPEIFNVGMEYRFPCGSRALLRYCGYVKRERGLQSPAQLRRQLKLGNRPLVLVTAGGGGDGYRLITSYLEGLCQGGRVDDAWSLILCGPEMPELCRKRILKLASGCPRVLVKEFTDDLMSYMGASDLVVSMGGYNTLCEILTLRKRAVIVPRIHPVQEQWIRCSRLSDMGLIRTLHPEQLSPTRLMRMVSEELQQGGARQEPLRSLDLDGLEQIGGWIGKLLDEPRPSAPTSATLQEVFRAPGGNFDHSVRALLGGNHEPANFFI